jgi:hypothetical protein
MRITELTDAGLRDGLAAIAEARAPLRVRAEDAEHKAELMRSEALSLRVIGGFLDVLEDAYRSEQQRRADEHKAD